MPESEYSPIIFFICKCAMALLGDHPPSLLNWSTWLSVKWLPFSMAALRTNLVATPCKRQKVALEPFTHGTNYTLLDADCVLTEKIGKSCKMEFQLWSVWIEVSSGIRHSHLSMSHFSPLQVNDCGIIKGTQFVDLWVSYGNWNSSFAIITLTYQHRDIAPCIVHKLLYAIL